MAEVDLSDFVDVLRREVNPPGTTVFTGADDDVYASYLADGFWEAALDGFFAGYTCDEDGLVAPLDTGRPDFPRAGVALIVLYAGIRILRNQIMNTNTGFRAKAGPVEFERQNSATMLAEMLKQLRETKTRLVLQIQEQTPVHAFDQLSTRIFSAISYYGSPELMG